ncbi:zinc finger and BTB domain-containing protein 40 isoform X4 [Bos javanicus]|uniref:zinc finger and BTB domain-containing protein 40 isoform X4 n=1 Tax=Bos javanicus TaxID=9906 RepID=UPI002AA6F0C8|nr:zinc finger and BTB domain-containing protein 40 isoform X4 [Bos javanicus]
MELPNYGRQLLQQLYTLCKEQQFCDCTISIGTIYFRAHKLVLAAASLLFKTLLDNTDTISIDASVVSPEEFALLLEMMYTGKLPVGKHNFSKIISLADSLQMFDVAVSCKNLLASLVNCSVQGQVVRDVSTPSEPSRKESEKPETEILSSEGAGEHHTSPEVSTPPEGPVKVEVKHGVHTAVQEMRVDPPAAQEVQGHTDTPGSHSAEVCPSAPVVQTFREAKEASTEQEYEGKHYQLNFLLENEKIFSDALLITQDVLKRLEECSEIKDVQKQTIMGCLEGEGQSTFQRILDKVKSESLGVQTVVSLLRLYQDSSPAVKTALSDRKLEAVEVVQPKALSPPGSTEEGKTLSVLLLEHKEDLIRCVTQLRPILEFLETVEEEFLPGSEKRVILNCCEGSTPKETIEKLLHRMSEEKTLSAESLVKLLQAVKMTFPDLGLLLENLQKLAALPSTTAQANPDDYGIELLRRYHENLSEIFTDNQVLLRMIPHVKSIVPGEKEVMEKLVRRAAGSRGAHALMSAVLEKHTVSAAAIWQLLLVAQETKPCPLSLLMEEIRREPGANAFFRAVMTPESAAFETILRHHRSILEAIQQTAQLKCLASEEERLAETVKEILSSSSETASPEASLGALLSRAAEKSISATEICQLLCSIHRSSPGLQPVMRELACAGKMYACQYCDAVFAQSIELSRHVRTHTGDKPYVCRDCGKGFRQANGLSIHLHTFHNIEDPYDCKKCRMSFPTLQDHRKHIHEVHSKEYHPCPTCGKIFSAPSMLERHMVTHVGGKPFSCGICNKAYQQLSGLWYHNRTHHPDVFAAQNHRSSKFSSLQCSSCDKTFSNTLEHKKHIKTEHADVKFHECDQCKELFPTPALLQVHVKCQHSGSQPFRCLYCAATFRFPGALQHHVTTEHFKQSESTFPCELCGELFTSQAQLDCHLESEHPKVLGTETQSQMVQVIQTPEPVAPTEQVVTLEETQLAGSQVFVTLPDSQTAQTSSELVAVTVEDLLDGTVTLICGEAK